MQTSDAAHKSCSVMVTYCRHVLKCIDVPVPVFISQESPVCADAACEMETADVGTVGCL